MNRRLILSRALTIVLAVVCGAGLLRAQAIRGNVVLADSSTAARAVIVLATDERGATVGRALTSDRGEFVLPLHAAGRYGIQVLRIGYRPTIVPPFVVADGSTVSVRVVLTSATIPLSTVNIRAQSECRVNPDSGLMVTQVWNEARKAILTSQLMAQGASLFATWTDYGRTLDATARFVRAQRVRTASHETAHAFRSLPAEELATRGYVISDSAETTFYAPDADVVMSPSFAALHCFRLVEAPPDRPTLIGVGFEPVRERRDIRDITGTFWVDRNTAELRSLEFRYTNLADAAVVSGAGGTVEFLRLANGNWLVNRWNVRMPRLGVPDKTSDGGQRRTIYATTPQAVTLDIQVTGGEVTRVTQRDTLLYQAEGHALAVQLTTRDSLVAAAGATVTLAGTDYSAKADATGRAVISPVLEGRYRARAQSGLMDSLGVAAVERDVEVRSEPGTDVHVDSIALPTARDILLKACPGASVKHGEGMLRGTVHDERGRELSHAAVTVTWQEGFGNAQGTSGNDQLAWHEKTLGALTDDAGRWRLCGVPRGVSLAARVAGDSGSDLQRIKLDEDRPFGAVHLVARHPGLPPGP